MESRVSEGVPFASLESLEGAESWSHEHLENLQIDTHRKIHLFQECNSFRSTTTNDEVIAENPFPNSGVTRRLWTRSRHMTLVVHTSF